MTQSDASGSVGAPMVRVGVLTEWAVVMVYHASIGLWVSGIAGYLILIGCAERGLSGAGCVAVEVLRVAVWLNRQSSSVMCGFSHELAFRRMYSNVIRLPRLMVRPVHLV